MPLFFYQNILVTHFAALLVCNPGLGEQFRVERMVQELGY
jgi:hypothetical protein